MKKTMLMILPAGLALSGATLAQDRPADAPGAGSPETIARRWNRAEAG